MLLIFVLLPSLLAPKPLKMNFDVEYDKTAHRYNLVINKRTATDRKMRRMVDKKSRATFGQIVGRYNRLARRLRRAIVKRKGLTDSPKLKNELEGLAQKVESTALRSKERARLQVSKAYEQSFKLYNGMVGRFTTNYDKFKTASTSEQERLKAKTTALLESGYRKQSTALQRKLRATRDSLRRSWVRANRRIKKAMRRLERGEKKGKGRELNNTADGRLERLERQAYDKRIAKYGKQLSSAHTMNRGKGVLSGQKARTLQFISSIRKIAADQESSDTKDPLAMIGLKGNPRVLETMAKLVHLAPPWLSYSKRVRVVSKSKARMLQYKKALIARTIKDLQDKHWSVVKKKGKRFAFIKQLDLYLPANNKAEVDQGVIDNLVRKLRKNYSRLLKAKSKSKGQTKTKRNLHGSKDKGQKQRSLGVTTDEAETKDQEAEKSADQGKPPIIKRKARRASLGAAAGGAAAGAAAGAAKGMEEKEKLRKQILDVEDKLSHQEIKDKVENDNFHRLFMVKIRLKRAVNHVQSIDRQFMIRLDAKREDLEQLLIEQEIQ